MLTLALLELVVAAAEPELHELSNGLRVVLERDDRLPFVAVNVTYAVGSAHDPPGFCELAHLTEHLTFEPLAHLGGQSPAWILYAAGAQRINATTHLGQTSFFATVPRAALETALWVESDRMGFFAPSPDAVERETDIVTQEALQNADEHADRAAWRPALAALLGVDHPTVRALACRGALPKPSRESVIAFHARYYAPNNGVLALVGNLPGDALAWVHRYFDDLPARGAHAAVSWRAARRDGPVELDLLSPLGPSRAWALWDEPSDLTRPGRTADIVGHLLARPASASPWSLEAHRWTWGRGGILWISMAATDLAPRELVSQLGEHVDSVLRDLSPERLEAARRALRVERALAAQDCAWRARRLASAVLAGEPLSMAAEEGELAAVTIEDARRYIIGVLAPERRVAVLPRPGGTP